MALELDAVLERLAKMPQGELKKLAINAQAVAKAHGMERWQPNPGSQTKAYFCDADEIGYGGELGPGKTALIIGKSITRHKRSLVLRRTNKEAAGLLDEYEKSLGYAPKLDRRGAFRVDGRKVMIGGCEHEADKTKYMGLPWDLIAVDQVENFLESQYTFFIQWNRSDDPEVKPQVLATLNPPKTPEGLWVIKRWGPWLDPNHPRPAKSGEIRWFTTIEGVDTEVDGPGPHVIEGEKEPVMAKSRTFIRGYLKENVGLARTGYDATRAAAPKEYRQAYRFGDFEDSLRDVPNQVCPTAWVRAAVRRWEPGPQNGAPMCAIADDASGGGDDPMVLAMRHDGWYAPLIVIPGKDIPAERAGKYAAGLLISYRRDDANVIIDMGGGYGGSTYEQLKANGIQAEAFKGAERSTRRTKDGKLTFLNRRTEIAWRFREALDPSEPGGSPIMLPDDPELFADLTALIFFDDRGVIQLEPKDDLCKRLGRSTNKGDAVLMAWAAGPKVLGPGEMRAPSFPYRNGRRPEVVMGRGKHSLTRRH